MLENIIECLRPKILSLPWIDRYGGLVRVAKKVQEVEGKIFTELYPVSCEVSETECWKNGMYLDLCPNDRYRSVTYFEKNGQIDVTEDRTKFAGQEGVMKFTADVTFVAWLNLPKLGISDCHSAHIFQYSIIRKLLQKNAFEGNFASVDVKIKSIDPHADSAFAKYYGGKFNNLFYPFDKFTVSFTLTWWNQIKCVPEYILPEEINCP